MTWIIALWLAVPAVAGLHRFACSYGYRYERWDVAAREGIAVATLLVGVEMVLLIMYRVGEKWW
jgi:hypothetical protein